MQTDAWLPNLTAGISIWSLASDLNRPALFDGRLLVPRVEGPSNLPVKIEWNVTGLVPLAEARRTHPVEAERAIDDFARCVERALATFEQEGFAKHRAAFTLPSLDGPHYFFSPDDGKLYATCWGASPRKITQRTEHVVDAMRFGELAKRAKQNASVQAVVVSEGTRRSYAWLALIPLLLALALVVFVFTSDDDDPAPLPEIPTIPAPEDDPPPPRIDVPPPPPPLPAPHQRIHFARGDDRLDDDQRESLDAIATYLRDHPEVRALLIEGHADFHGSEPDNLSLSGERALRVRDRLIESGIDAARLRCAACSELHPLEPNAREEGQRANRRVEFFVIDPPIDPRPHEDCSSVAR